MTKRKYGSSIVEEYKKYRKENKNKKNKTNYQASNKLANNFKAPARIKYRH